MKKKSKVMLRGVKLEQAEDYLTIRLTRFDMKLNRDIVLLVVQVAIGLLLLLLQRIGTIISAFEIKTIGVICCVVGLVILVGSVKMTAIRVTQDAIEVNLDNEQGLTVRDVRKIYVEFSGVHKKLSQFRIVAVNQAGKQWILVSQLTQERAEYVVNVIQNYLRLEEAA